MEKNKKKDDEIEFNDNKDDLIKHVSRINKWEWIPIIGPYLFFVRLNFQKINYVKEIRKGFGKELKKMQLSFALVSLPFVIWTIILIVQEGFGFKLSAIGIIVPFCIQFFSPLPFQKLILKGLV